MSILKCRVCVNKGCHMQVASGVAARDLQRNPINPSATHQPAARALHQPDSRARRATRRIGDGRLIRPATARTDPSTAASQPHRTLHKIPTTPTLPPDLTLPHPTPCLL